VPGNHEQIMNFSPSLHKISAPASARPQVRL